MNEMELKTSWKQRIVISLIAIVMVGSIIASYVAIVASGNGGGASADTAITDDRVLEYETAYTDKVTEFQAATNAEYTKYSQHLGEIRGYDESEANSGEVKVQDLLGGDGRELVSGDTDYIAFYAGWCADGTVFDSSLDSATEPHGFVSALPASAGLITGWTNGVVGMRLGGVRELTIPGKDAYQDQMEICGGYNKPLKFLILAVANEEPLKGLVMEVQEAYMKVQYAHYGIDYEKMSK